VQNCYEIEIRDQIVAARLWEVRYRLHNQMGRKKA